MDEIDSFIDNYLNYLPFLLRAKGYIVEIQRDNQHIHINITTPKRNFEIDINETIK